MDQLRHAIKEDLREDVLGYLDELNTANSYQELPRFTDELNGSDLGNLAEDWYQRHFAPNAEQHAHVSRQALSGRAPPVAIERDRVVDQLMPDGTAVEIKSIVSRPRRERHVRRIAPAIAIVIAATTGIITTATSGSAMGPPVVDA